jgi:uncharacterized protein
MRIIRALLIAIASAYFLFVAAIWYTQASFIFLPSRTVDATPAESGVKFDNITLPIQGAQIAGWWVPAEDPQQAPTLLYFHGNAGNVAANRDHVLRLRGAGLNVFIIDYRGYGASTGGPPREKKLYEDGERAWQYLVAERNIAPAHIAIYGHSLGSAVAIDLASRHPEAGALIVEGALTSIAGVAEGIRWAAFLPVRLILTERFDSLSKIAKVRPPKLFLHGDADRMNPRKMAQRLYDAASEPKHLAMIPGGGHSDSAETNPTVTLPRSTAFSSNMAWPAAASERPSRFGQPAS